MIRRGPEPRSLQRNGLARIVHHRDAHEVLVPDDASRRIEVDPPDREQGLDPSVGLPAGNTGVVIIIVVGKMEISGHEPRSDASVRKRRYHEHGESRQLPLAEIQSLNRVLGTFLVPSLVLEGPPDGLRHVDEKLVRVGRSVRAQELGGPQIDAGVLGIAAR